MKKQLKCIIVWNVVWASAALIFLLVAGCLPTTAQVQTVTNKTDTLMVVVDKMQETFDVLVKDGVIESEKMEALSEEIDKAQEHIIVINEAVKEKVDQGALEQAKAGWDATKDFNPYYAYGALALTIIGEGAALLNANKKNKGLEKGISRVKGEAEPELAKKIHDTLKIYTG